MRIAYLGNFDPPYSTENDVRKAFRNLGHEVIQLQENRATWQQVREAALASDLLLITSTWDEAQPFKETLDTLRLCAMMGIATAAVHLDLFWGSDRGVRNWCLNPMFYTRYVFTADGDHQAEWAKLGIDHRWLRPGVRHDAVHNGTFREEFRTDVAFVGSNGIGYHDSAWPYRKRLLSELHRICKKNGWSFRNPGGDNAKIDRGEDMNDFYASARVTVGDSLCLQGSNTRYWSDRAYEAPGRGALLIMPTLTHLSDDYDGTLPMYNFGDFDGLERKISYYLNHEDDNRAVRRETQAFVSERHTYVNRVRELLESVGLS